LRVQGRQFISKKRKQAAHPIFIALAVRLCCVQTS